MMLECACCGGEAPSRAQWFNQDAGWSICPRCFLSNCNHPSTGREQALKHYGWPGRHHSIDETPQLFLAVLACGIKHASHETDLYLPITPQTTNLLRSFPLNNANKTTFTNQVEGGLWYDIPFAYLPAWEAKPKAMA